MKDVLIVIGKQCRDYSILEDLGEFAYDLVVFHGSGSISYQIGLIIVLVEGCVFLAMVAFDLCARLACLIPRPVRLACTAGIALFIAFLGLQYSQQGIGLVRPSSSTLVTLTTLQSRADNRWSVMYTCSSSTSSVHIQYGHRHRTLAFCFCYSSSDSKNQNPPDTKHFYCYRCTSHSTYYQRVREWKEAKPHIQARCFGLPSNVLRADEGNQGQHDIWHPICDVGFMTTLGGINYKYFKSIVGAVPPPLSLRFRHNRSKNANFGNHNPKLHIFAEQLVYIVLSAIHRKCDLLLFALSVYIYGMLLYMRSLSLEVIAPAVVVKPAPLGSLPMVFPSNTNEC
uniref:Uncharacterized protein n=1 Tax=Nelumbo nucifera TaxID=4432 RepID=A0A822XSY9_NELNU|nr:TPA_asm: hypothetical protein HUJ06_023398 [Nelumbo nucifera]